MISVIIYAEDPEYLDQTISGIIDHTPDLHQIIVCDDIGIKYKNKDVIVQLTDHIGRAKAWNQAATICNDDDILAFMRDTTKVEAGWIQEVGDNLICSPKINMLDPEFWVPEQAEWKNFGWRWDLNLYDRGGKTSPAVSSYCMVMKRKWFDIVGGFDEKLSGCGSEDIDISIRSWLCGGGIKIFDSHIACQVKVDDGNLQNKARVVEKWYPQYSTHFYNFYGINRSDLQVGPISDRSWVRPPMWFLNYIQPELQKIYHMHGIAHGKTIAVVAPGHSIDKINKAIISRHDIIIGADLAAEKIDCDYVICDNYKLVVDLLDKYKPNAFILPHTIIDDGKLIETEAMIGGCQQYEPAVLSSELINAYPPFYDFNYIPCAAIQLAIFMKPTSITMYGFDTTPVGGTYHCSGLRHKDYKAFDTATVEYAISRFSKLAVQQGIQLFRMNHA